MPQLTPQKIHDILKSPEALKQYLGEKSDNVNSIDSDDRTLLELVVLQGNIAMVKIMLDGLGGVNVPDSKGRPAIILACKYNKIELVQALLREENIRIDAQNIHGDTALILAVKMGHIDVGQILLDHGANRDILTYITGTSALMWAAIKRNEGMVNILLENGADVNLRSNHQETALYYALEGRHRSKNIILKLLEYGVDTDVARIRIDIDYFTITLTYNKESRVYGLDLIDLILAARAADDALKNGVPMNLDNDLGISRIFHKIMQASTQYPLNDLSENAVKIAFEAFMTYVLKNGVSDYDDVTKVISAKSAFLPVLLSEKIIKLMNDNKTNLDYLESMLRGDIEGISGNSTEILKKRTELLKKIAGTQSQEEIGQYSSELEKLSQDWDFGPIEETASYYNKHKEELKKPGTYLARLDVAALTLEAAEVFRDIFSTYQDHRMVANRAVQDFISNYQDRTLEIITQDHVECSDSITSRKRAYVEDEAESGGALKVACHDYHNGPWGESKTVELGGASSDIDG